MATYRNRSDGHRYLLTRIRPVWYAALLAGGWLLILGMALAAEPDAMSPMQVVDRLQERIARCRDYQYEVVSYERLGSREERRNYRLFVKDCRLVRVRITSGRGKGSEAVI